MKFVVLAMCHGLPVTTFGFTFGARGSEETLVSLDDSTWRVQDDPVMGGGSRSTWSVLDGVGVWAGVVTDVTSLSAPGFCSVKTTSRTIQVDASKHILGGLVLKVRSSTPEYDGFKLRFASPNTPRHHFQHGLEGIHSSSFKVPPSAAGEWQSLFLPFDGFSWDFSDYTGDCTTLDPDGFQHRCCSEENRDVCPTSEELATIDGFAIFAEGVNGEFQLDVKEIAVDSRDETPTTQNPQAPTASPAQSNSDAITTPLVVTLCTVAVTGLFLIGVSSVAKRRANRPVQDIMTGGASGVGQSLQPIAGAPAGGDGS